MAARDNISGSLVQRSGRDRKREKPDLAVIWNFYVCSEPINSSIPMSAVFEIRHAQFFAMICIKSKAQVLCLSQFFPPSNSP